MQKGLLDLHNLLRWIILILLVVNIIKNYADTKKPFAKIHKKLGLWLMICAHITLIVGLVLLGFHWVNLPAGLNVMKDPALRFIFVEHPVGMIIAIILITIGKGVAKKDISDIKKHRKSATLYLVALIIILASIPWNAPMIPGM
ncbi:MAG TPA: hypothetical protein VFQ86_01600 [Arachidicoccus soli]|uniref:Cytochrome B n=1 Tax=Arachidicoccus soli TaxID=2341117 RepID=A0A386HMW4_9BACT|nr:hypothetical protein [Arachidicoccus soli]AYD46956.1 hypothetical protein D6B99_04605 [Arachidicoccus soli]HEU0226407.1 hypothetical protein [Arachidicoccus soli]